MGRIKINRKNENLSISLPATQIEFIKAHKDFNISKFTQIILEEFINSYYSMENKK